VLSAVSSGNQRVQREGSGIRCSAEGQRCEGVGSPPEAAKDMPGVLANGREGIIQRLPAYRVVDNIEPYAAGMFHNKRFPPQCRVVDRGRSKLRRDLSLVWRNRCETRVCVRGPTAPVEGVGELEA
jgi:hypothetical protein